MGNNGPIMQPISAPLRTQAQWRILVRWSGFNWRIVGKTMGSKFFPFFPFFFFLDSGTEKMKKQTEKRKNTKKKAREKTNK